MAKASRLDTSERLSKFVIFAKTGSTSTFRGLTLGTIDEGFIFLQIHLSLCAPKIGAAPVVGQALLPKKTLRRKVSLVKHHVRWSNICQSKANEMTDVLQAPDPTNLWLRCLLFVKYAFIVD